jgi:RHS repeat-associated protein
LPKQIKPKMNSISTTSSIKNGIPAGSAVLWARGVFDATGKLVESLSYDPWGRRRNPNNWTDYNISSTLFDRGFTGHEHLPQFGLINMNGRVYDPFLARFLSPDPFVQAPDYSQNFNRYSYAFNNPLKYTDPDGEWVHLVAGAVIGGIANLAMNWNNVDNFWQGLGYFGIGAGAGALAAGTGAGFGALASGSGSFSFMSATGLTAAGVMPGAAAGSTAGFTSGLVTGTGNSLMQGEKLKQSLGNGLKSGAWGFTIGGVTGGLFGGYQAHRLGNNILTGNPVGGRLGNIPELQQFGRLTSNLDPVELNMSNIRRPGMSLVDEMAQPNLKPGIYGKVQGLGEVNRMSEVRALGIAGEEMVGVGAKTRIPSLTGTAKYRIPDIFTPSTLGEVKNVNYLSLTRQLNDFHLYSNQTGRQFMLYTRPTTTFSMPLQNLINSGNIIVKPIIY